MNRIISHTIAAIVAIALTLFTVHIAKGVDPVYHKCVESGFEFRRHDKWGSSYDINYIFETQSGVRCADTATKDALELAIKETFDTLARVGKSNGSALFRNPDGWQTYMTIKRSRFSHVIGLHKTETSEGIIIWDHDV